MLPALAFNPGDITQALRLVKWLGFLSRKNGNDMGQQRLLLVVSQQASIHSQAKEIYDLAKNIFLEVHVIIPEEHETGWPGAANWMFKAALEHVENTEYRTFRDDLFWLEPDAIPLTPTWFDQIQEEWEIAQTADKTFLGNQVTWDIPHMTGVAVYGRRWRDVAPSLADCPDTEAFDTHAGPEVLPHAHITPLIQHVFRRHEPGWTVPGLNILDKRAVIFHQDKKGKLIQMIDGAQYQGECAEHPVFGYLNTFTQEKVMTKFYRCCNATKAVRAHGHRFIFQPVESFGGSMPGVFTTDLEDEQNILSSVASDPSSGITELTQEEWEAEAKKKWSPPVSNTSKPLNETSNPQPGLQASLVATPSKRPAVVVAEKGSAGSKEAAGQSGPIKDISDVIKVDVVQSAQTPNIGSKLPRPENAKGFNRARRIEAEEGP